ncbi:MAG: dihydrodipicolinate reductase [Deltaproteobacteria bacterium]|nr:dihydrodipicolinate reductase [Deltaproteobacteria bacterium]
MSRFRVVQWSTGNVGRQALAAILDHPDLELVGLFAFDRGKAGQDAGELCGRDPVGVTATNDVDALIALAPDCVVYTPAYGDDETVVRFLEAGINVVTTSGYISVPNGPRGADFYAKIEAAARRGHASLLGTGLNPGFVHMLAMIMTIPMREVRSVSWEECANVGFYNAPEMWKMLGFGLHPEERAKLVGSEGAAPGTPHSLDGIPYLESCYAVAHALGIQVDGHERIEEVAVATEPVKTLWTTYAKGTVAGLRTTYVVKSRGKAVVTSRLTWSMGDAVEPKWKARHGYSIDVDGDPAMTLHFGIRPGSASNIQDIRRVMDLGMIATACPAVNAVPAVCRAAPGILNYSDLPIHAAGFCG